MALPTNGRVIIETSVGELDIELWSKETPKACRNFLALAMEGYYDGVIFHRIVPDFLVQTGDKTGTGGGGESFYGEQFEDEIHPRLRFAHRGLVALANNGTKNSNDSQFFITLDRADELHGKHTLFGRCVGDTIFNVMKIGAMEINEDGRPLYPPKIKTIRIIDNPFPDIIPRITAAEKRVQEMAREKAQKEREEEMRRRGAKKDTKLLSFQDEAAEEEPITFKKKSISRPDLIDNPDLPALNQELLAAPSKSKQKVQDEPEPENGNLKVLRDKGMKSKEEEDILKIREKHAKEKAAAENARAEEISKLESEIRRMENKRRGPGSDDEGVKKKVKRSYLEEELAKYEKARGLKSKRDTKGKKVKDESDDILARMNSFRGKLKNTFLDEPETVDHENEQPTSEKKSPEMPENQEEAEGMEVDDDTGFLSHILHFPKDDGEETRKAERDYEVIDPRQRSARAREEEKQRKKQMKPRDGGRGSRRH